LIYGLQKRRTCQEGDKLNYCDCCDYYNITLIFIISGLLENSIPESTWESKRTDIAEKIDALRDDTCRGLLRDGWVRYLREAYSEGEEGQQSRRVDATPREKLIVPQGDV